MEQPRAHYDYASTLQEVSTNDDIGSPIGGSDTLDGHVWDCGNAGPTLRLSLTAGVPNASVGKAVPAFFRAFAAADVAGTLNIQQSPDGTNWFQTATAVIPASFTTGVGIESNIYMRYVRAQVVNGSGAQTDFELDTMLLSR